MKPIKRGYKLWSLACMSSYVYNFDIYQEKFQAFKDDLGFALDGRVLRQMTESLTEKENIAIFDNFFSSVSLLEQLKDDGIFACCTIRSIRKGLHILAPNRTSNRANLDRKHGVYKGRDSKTVLFASSYHGI